MFEPIRQISEDQLTVEQKRIIGIGRKELGEFKPLVIIETKSPNRRLGIDQLQTYFISTPTAKLGFWTDGSFIKAFSKSAQETIGESNADIPMENELKTL